MLPSQHLNLLFRLSTDLCGRASLYQSAGAPVQVLLPQTCLFHARLQETLLSRSSFVEQLEAVQVHRGALFLRVLNVLDLLDLELFERLRDLVFVKRAPLEVPTGAES